MIRSPGLGTQLRELTALLDGDVEQLYARQGEDFRARFYPYVRHLLFHDTAQIGELAKAAGVTQPAATQTIHEMQRRGLVKILTGSDRRARDIALSAKGRAVVGRLQPLWAAIHAAADDLDGELPFALSSLLTQAITSLRARSFATRVDQHLSGT
jgi:MarR family transcriptional regulator, organic hydroperoxide resistance regulator